TADRPSFSMAPATRSDLDSPIRLIRRPPMRPPAPATTTLIMLVSCSPFLLFATYRWLITVAGGAEPDDLATWASGATHGATNRERHVCARRRDGEAAAPIIRGQDPSPSPLPTCRRLIIQRVAAIQAAT